MGFKKYQSVEKQEVLSPGQHEQVADQLRRLGKTSATELTDAERQSLRIDLPNDE